MKVSELEGAKLDYWVAKAEGHRIEILTRSEYCDYDGPCVIKTNALGRLPPLEIGKDYSPSTKWAYGGPIIERERVWLSNGESCWYASMPPHSWVGEDKTAEGPTALVTAMRAFVASKFGDTVED